MTWDTELPESLDLVLSATERLAEGDTPTSRRMTSRRHRSHDRASREARIQEHIHRIWTDPEWIREVRRLRCRGEY